MSKLKFFLGLWLGKISIPALKITHHTGSDYPGILACRICPNFLSYVNRPKKLCIITGTNGKTTVNNMLVDVLKDNNVKVFSNLAGSNIATGISTVFIKGSNIFGRLKNPDMVVLEVDERTAPKVYPYLNPDYVVVTNLSRDSILRNAHPQYIADILTNSIPKHTKMILNAEDLISGNVAKDNERVYFGIDKLPSDKDSYDGLLNDMQICPKCAGKLKYNYLRYNHIGNATCTDCGFTSPKADISVTSIDEEKAVMTVYDRELSKEYTYPLITDSVFNVYNLVTVIATAKELGLTHEQIISSMKKTAIPGSRHSEDKVGSIRVITQMAKEKNASATTRAFDYVSAIDGNREVLLMMNCLNDIRHWSENICWMYDTDFELLNQPNIKKIVCAGARRDDYKLRLLLAGVPEDRIVLCEDEVKAAECLSYDKDDIICLFHGVDSTKLAETVKTRILELAKEKEASR